MSSRLRASVLGGVDGVVSSFAVVAGSHAHATNTMNAVLVVGISSVLADGFSMGVSEYVSTSAQLARDKGSLSGRREALRLGLSCFAAFLACGAVPLASYAASGRNLLSSAMFSLATLMLLGAARTRASGEPLLYGLAQTAVLGSAAGLVAYGIGLLVESQLPDE